MSCVRLVVALMLALGSTTVSAKPAGEVHARGKHAAPKGTKGAKSARATVAPALATTQAASSAGAVVPSLGLAGPIERMTLDNGLRVVLAPDAREAACAVAVVYDAGSRAEERGRGGLAALASELFFAGSANVREGEHARLIEASGGRFDANVTSDAAVFVEWVPAGELPLALWLEADRMKSTHASAKAFDAARVLLRAHAEQRASDDSLARATSRLRELAFQAYWPYEHDVLGAPSELDAVTSEAVSAFGREHYAPNEAALVVTGDFDLDHASQLVHRFFDTAKPREPVPSYAPPQLPEQTSQRAAVLEDARAATAAFLYGWVIPPVRTDEHYALTLAAEVLAGGEGARLDERLSHDRRAAFELHASVEGRRGPDLLAIRARLAEGHARADVERAVESEVAALGKTGPTEAELARARARTHARLAHEAASLESRAEALGRFELFFGDARLFTAEPGRYAGIPREAVRAAVARYLTPSRRTLIEVIPPGEPAVQKVLAKPLHAKPSQPSGLARTRHR